MVNEAEKQTDKAAEQKQSDSSTIVYPKKITVKEVAEIKQEQDND